LLQDVVHVAQFGFVLGGQDQLFFFERYAGLAALEIKALLHFLHGLVDGVGDLGAINLGNDVE
jgi:hypothetical protein